MINVIMKMAVRSWFAFTSKDKASKQTRIMLDKYLSLAEQTNSESGAIPVLVPRMPGVDEDMRNWSFFMLLEHNAIVNQSIITIVQSLAQGEEPLAVADFDPKKDVMPSQNAGAEQIDAFRSSVEDYLNMVSKFGKLRGGMKRRHPIFGDFDAHKWHCMFRFHLLIHYKQARCIIKEINEE